MNKLIMLRNLLVISVLAILAGCANPKIDNAEGKRVLIVAGEGMNSTYEDQPSANAFLHDVGKTFATDLGLKLEEFGVEPFLFVSKDSATLQQQYQRVINRMLESGKVDGIAKVEVLHTKDEQTNEIALHVTYYTTEPWVRACERNLTNKCNKVSSIKEVGTMKYVVVDGKTQQFNQTPINKTVTNMALFIYRAEQ
ncbi:hypothetical protein [Photobacterium nomapromontoriensis]|uniref:hypothetical protein n=1 Tax=Photobacterium nomapromontoriensis TaxID=2910237 RepID=UPI003D0BFB69